MGKLSSLLFCLVYSLTTPCFSANNKLNKNLEDKIRIEVESSRIKKNNLGLVIANSDGDIVYQLNANQKFSPASLTKIVTAAAVLDELPIGHQFVTQVLIDREKVDKSVLNGSIYLQGGGDAGFVSESMWFLVNEFTREEITEIKGDIIVDDSRFDSVRFDQSRDQSRVDRAYDSPIGAMTFNWSAVNIFVRPGTKVGDPAKVYTDPSSEYFKIVNKTKTTNVSSKQSLTVKGRGLSEDKQNEVIEVTGSIPFGAKEFVAYKSVVQPEIWAGVQFREFLKQRKIQVNGQVRAGVAAKNLNTVAMHKSKPIGELVSGMLKFSNNYTAEILTKNLAAEKSQKPATMDGGLSYIKKYLAKLGITDFSIVNPSGLSRGNQMKPIDLLTLLRGIQSNFKIFPEFLSGLAISGVDGTLRKRMNGQAGRVRAKTGHLSGVSGLAGYASSHQHGIHSFVFVHNGGIDESYRAKNLFDEILDVIVSSDK